MTKLAALLAAFPLAVLAQTAGPSPQPAPAAPAYVPPAPQQAAPAPQYAPPAYVPPPQYAPPAAYAPPQAGPPGQRQEKQRDRWYIGFGLGGGDGSLELSDGSHSFEDYVGTDPTQVFLNFKVGATITPKLLLGFDLTAIRSEFDGGGATAGAQVTNYDAVATFFPTGRGFFLRGGVGLSAFGYDVETGYGSASDSTTGVNVLGGVGYAFWLGKAFNLTLNLDASAQSYGEQDDAYALLPESSSFWSLYVGFDWY
jgi:hypothetical protein